MTDPNLENSQNNDPSAKAGKVDESKRQPEEGNAGREMLNRMALRHYRLGNRFFERRAWDRALKEWRQAAGIWDFTPTFAAFSRRFMQFKGVIAFLFTVLLVYNLVFTFLPRDPFEMLILSGNEAADSRSWWERFMDSGRPRQGEGGKQGIRDWWEQLRRSFGQGEPATTARRRMGLPGVDERWADLLQRYGQYGPFFNFELDYNLIAGGGLSRLGEYEKAVEVLNKGIENTDSALKKADLFQGLANTHYFKGYQQTPDGLAQYHLEYVQKAMEAYENSVKYQPRPVSYGNLGWMLYLLGDYPEAIDASKKALNMDGNIDYVRLNLGLSYLVQNRIYDSFDMYREVVERSPPKDVFQGGINDLRELVRDKPGKHPFAHMMMGLLAARSGDYSLAKNALNQFIASPNIGSSWRQSAVRMLNSMDVKEFTP